MKYSVKQRTILFIRFTKIAVITLLLSRTSNAEPYASKEVIERAKAAAAGSATMPFAAKQVIASKSTIATYSDLELNNIISLVLKEGIPNSVEADAVYLQQAQEAIVNKLKQFKASGFAVAHHTDLAFFWGGLYTDLDVLYKNDTGKINTKKFTLNMPTIGLKFDMGYQIDLVFFTNCDAFNFYETNKTITMNRGIRLDVTLPYPYVNNDFEIQDVLSAMDGIIRTIQIKQRRAPLTVGLTYAPFAEMQGGIVIVSLGFHLFNNYDPKNLAYLLEGLSLVRKGATLTPGA